MFTLIFFPFWAFRAELTRFLKMRFKIQNCSRKLQNIGKQNHSVMLIITQDEYLNERQTEKY